MYFNNFACENKMFEWNLLKSKLGRSHYIENLSEAVALDKSTARKSSVGQNMKMAPVVKSCTVSVAISWIRSLITSRRVCIGAYGARRFPQGTLLGPVFFLVYISA